MEIVGYILHYNKSMKVVVEAIKEMIFEIIKKGTISLPFSLELHFFLHLSYRKRRRKDIKAMHIGVSSFIVEISASFVCKDILLYYTSADEFYVNVGKFRSARYKERKA